MLADTQDNPGAGGASDTVGVLEALVAERADDAIFGVVYDPQAARAAHSGGVGAELSLSLGAKSGQAGQAPFRGLFTVEALSEGEFAGTGPMAIGVTFRMGLCAVLRIGGVKVLVGSARAQVKDQAIFRHIGLDPSAVRIVALKSSVHFRADFQAMAQDVLIVVSPGPNMADHLAMPYQHLRRGLLLTPDGPAFS
ncbi:MAG: hypothetical protein HOI95_01815 [Chromatiales bacterium]|nr:hypothetical protein [Chromatiales bacterium]